MLLCNPKPRERSQIQPHFLVHSVCNPPRPAQLLVPRSKENQTVDKLSPIKNSPLWIVGGFSPCKVRHRCHAFIVVQYMVVAGSMVVASVIGLPATVLRAGRRAATIGDDNRSAGGATRRVASSGGCRIWIVVISEGSSRFRMLHTGY